MMMETLEKAFEEASRLSRAEQEELAAWILEELAAERRWSDLLETSHDHLAEPADEALAEHAAGQTQPLVPDEL